MTGLAPRPDRHVDGVSLSVARGEVLAVIGYSGAGKSTLVRLVNALEQPTSGSVRFDGQDITALVIQQPNFFGVLEDVDALTDWARARGIFVIASVNPTSLALLRDAVTMMTFFLYESGDEPSIALSW